MSRNRHGVPGAIGSLPQVEAAEGLSTGDVVGAAFPLAMAEGTREGSTAEGPGDDVGVVASADGDALESSAGVAGETVGAEPSVEGAALPTVVPEGASGAATAVGVVAR